jgi:B12-binding domain/radical SAM domain protein
MAASSADAIYLQYGKQNKYSWASVIAPLEARGVFKTCNLDLVTIPASMEPVFDQIQRSNAMHHFILFTVNSYHSHKILKDIRKANEFRIQGGIRQKVHIIAGGPHANVRPAELLDAGVDYAFIKEGEVAIVDFFTQFYKHARKEDNVQNQGQGQGKDRYREVPFIPEAVPNCYYKDAVSGTMKYTFDASLVSLDDYPPIAADHRMFRPIEITRGCPHGCHFCLTPQIFGYASRHRSVENTICWVERAVKLKYKRVWFMAPNSLAYGSKGSKPNVPVIERLLKGVKQIPGLQEVYFGTFPSEVRPEFVTRDVMEAIVPHVTNDTFVMGAQSASPAILKTSHRGHTIEDVWNAVDIITGVGCKVDIDMIFGIPGETVDDETCNIEFIKQVLERPGVRIHGHVFMPLPGTVFEHEQPGSMSPALLKVIGNFTKAGKVFGQHFVQVGRAKRIKKNSEITAQSSTSAARQDP